MRRYRCCLRDTRTHQVMGVEGADRFVVVVYPDKNRDLVVFQQPKRVERGQISLGW